jgi:hypothetical protein
MEWVNLIKARINFILVLDPKSFLKGDEQYVVSFSE